MDQPVIQDKDKSGAVYDRTPKNRAEAETYLREEYQRLYGKTAAAEKVAKPAKADEVVRILEGGKRAIFNSKTREFIRYAD
jgi:hypothetical protein